jgi:DNA polymerase bacteriophage-type
VVEWEEQYGEKYPWVGAMRDYRKANILLKKLQTMQRHSHNGILPFSLLYFGAHTGRFSGAGKLNFQNLPNRKESFVNLRHAICARPGHRLCIVDWRQIEPRILRWAVKDTEALALLAQGVSIYETYAMQHLGWKTGNLKKEDPRLYGLAKAAVLGAGYGCGGKKYRGVAFNMAGVELTDEEAEQQVAFFRQCNPRIVQLWNALNFQGRLHAREGKDFRVNLPSGRQLWYLEPLVTKGLTAYTCLDKQRKAFLHGGLLTENFIQAIARDVFVVGMLRLARAGFQNLFHVHDEYVLEIPEDCDTAKTEAEIRSVLLEPIHWLPDCPLDVEMKWGERYG